MPRLKLDLWRPISAAALFLAALGFTHFAAPSRTEAQSRFPAEMPRIPGVQARSMLHVIDWANCLISRNRDEARIFAQATSGSEAERASAQRLVPYAETTCDINTRRLRASTWLLKGMVAQNLLERDFGTPLIGAAGDSRPPTAPSPSRWTNNTPADQGYAGELIAACYVPKNVAATHVVLRTRIGSDEEFSALNAIVTAFGDCAPDRPVLLSPLLFRASLATAYYQLAVSRGLRPSAAASPTGRLAYA